MGDYRYGEYQIRATSLKIMQLFYLLSLDDDVTLEMVADQSLVNELPAEAPTDTQIDASLLDIVDTSKEEQVIIEELESEILTALGASTSEGPEYGEKIHENLAQLWLPLLKKGLPKEEKEKLLKDLLVPLNCNLLQAPKLNPEISAAITESTRNRDKKLVSCQQQLGAGVTAVNRAMDLLLNKEFDKIKVIKHLSDACRILSDLHHRDSQTRIKLITPSLDKSFLNIIQDTCRDETLFGTKLSEKIKASKTVEKQGLQIKKTFVTSTAPSTSTNTRPLQSRGNWGAPPRYPPGRGGRGGNRKPTPMYTRKPPATSPAQAKYPAKTQTRNQAQS